MYTHQAQKDIHEIQQFIAKDNKTYADKVTENILWFIWGVLSAFPKLGHSINTNLFEIIEPTFKYKIIYTLNKNNITIIAIFKRQNR